jgi:phosphoesterase RecJ-like protein
MTGMTPIATDPPLAADLAAARRRVERAGRALVLTHIAPDGDAIGSLLGFGLALQAAGKTVVLACADPVPEAFRFLPGADAIVQQVTGAFDLVVAVDAADLGRLGVLGERLPAPPHLLFDHHVTNPGYAAINLIDTSAASTAELIAEHLPALGLPLTQPCAECLLAGVITDTLGFRTSTTSAKTLSLTQTLMAAGASLPEIYDLAFYKRSFAAVRLWAEGLARLKLEERIVWAELPLAARQAAGYYGQGDADLINILTSVREADVAIIFVERSDGKVKISWRAAPGINVASLAASFGGGGHAPAAGAEVAGTLPEVEAQILAATRALLNSNHR